MRSPAAGHTATQATTTTPASATNTFSVGPASHSTTSAARDDPPAARPLKGNPQWGQLAATPDTCPSHSGHRSNAIADDTITWIPETPGKYAASARCAPHFQ